MFRALVLGFRYALGGLLVGLGPLVGVVGLCGVLVFLHLWASGDVLGPGDRRAWGISAAATLLGALATGAGVWLWPGQRSGAGTGRMTPLPAHQRALLPVWTTAGWLSLAAALLWTWAAAANLPVRLLWTGLGLGGCFLGLHAVVLAHEGGHLGAAALLGMDLLSIQVGEGPRLFGIDLPGGLRVEWRLWPTAGRVHAADDRLPGWRCRGWLFIAAGPLAHALLLGGVTCWLARVGWWQPWGAVDPTHGARLVASFLLWPGATLLLGALIPQPVRVGGEAAFSDAHWLLAKPRMSAEAVEATVIVGRMVRAERLWRAGRRTEAWARVRETLARFPGRPVLSVTEGVYLRREGDPLAAAENFQARAAEAEAAGWPLLVRLRLALEEAIAWLQAGEIGKARALCVGFLAGVTDPAERAEALDTFASLPTHFGARALLGEAEAWSAEMLALEPAVLTRQVTRGAVLVQLGRTAEGAALLGPVWERSGAESDVALAAFGLALAARARGDRAGLRRWRRRARRFARFTTEELAARIAGAELTDGAPPKPEDVRQRVDAVQNAPVPAGEVG